ncbi:Hypothetical protein, putative [Bodo saltans]|uniref:Uncharacterized protein n=1 Tax=Bodo saltans TaxID=75058 RepID=A0A0S4JTG9_BODSA|nr:Hypothetical protein, putative [Bodo saltans]|eukprot:CUG92696.1 Hypothetical protein, putative [Bodo saltans]
MNDDLATISRSSDNSKRVGRKVNPENFSNERLKANYDDYLAKAQDHFLHRRFALASAFASRGARIYPTAQIFGLLAAIQEGLGHFDRASDFRLLQAFLGKDATLWQELLGEFLQQQKFFKATVCLQRLSTLEHADAARYRSLQIQLADLLVGLGEIKRASGILINLWQSSRYRDFEVFASLASMFFQIGRWSALNQLIKESFEHGFRKKNHRIGSAAVAQLRSKAEDDAESPSATEYSAETKRRQSKRISFMDSLMEEKEKSDENNQPQQQPTTITTTSGPILTSTSASSSSAQHDSSSEFGFDNLEDSSTTSLSAMIKSNMNDDASKIDLSTGSAKKNFLTLVNVQTELLNEQGKFEKTIVIVQRCAAHLDVPVLELPPDVLLRYGVALAFIGGSQFDDACHSVFDSLLMTSSLDVYGDALYDAAVSLESTGRREAAMRIFEALRRFQTFVANSEGLDISDDDGEDARMMIIIMTPTVVGGSSRVEELREKAERRIASEERRAARGTVKTTLAALTFYIGKCLVGLGRDSDAFAEFQAVLVLDPSHAESRVELSRLFMALGDLQSAATAVTPRDADDAYQTVLLSAQLLPVLKAQGRLLEAIGVGVALFQLFLANHDDEGDRLSTMSGMSGASRRRSRAGGSLYSMPTLTRASSSLVPASALSDAMNVPLGSSIAAGSMASASSLASKTYGFLKNRDAIAATFRSTASSMSAVTLSKRGSLTSTYAGSAAAASSIAGGGGARSDIGGLWNKDTTQLFTFNRRRQQQPPSSLDNSSQPPATTRQSNTMLVKRGGLTARQQRRREQKSAGQRRMEEYAQRLAADTAKKVRSNQNNDDENAAMILDNDAVDGASVGNLEDLEEMERMLAEEEAQLLLERRHSDEDGDPNHIPTQQHRGGRRTELPTNNDYGVVGDEAEDHLRTMDLQQIASNTFDDPHMAALFLECTGSSGQKDGGGEGGGPVGINAATAPPAPPPPPPNSHDILRMIGKNQLIALAVDVVSCYSELERYVEAKEFGRIILLRWSALHHRSKTYSHHALAHKLRLALLKTSLLSGETEDAVTTALQLLSSAGDGEEEDILGWRNECWAVLATLSEINSHGTTPLLLRMLVTVCTSDDDGVVPPRQQQTTNSGGGTSGHILGRDISLATLFRHKAITVPGLCNIANASLSSGVVRPALNTYLLALSMRPHCPFLNFMVGISYCCAASQRTSGCVHDLVSSGLHYVQEYRRLSLASLSSLSTGVVADSDSLSHKKATQRYSQDGVAALGTGAAESMIGAAFYTNDLVHCQQSDAVTYHNAKRLEVEYNTARVLHYLNLHYLCVPMYEALITEGKRLLSSLLSSQSSSLSSSAAAQPIRMAQGQEQKKESPAPPPTTLTDAIALLVRCASINLYVLYSGVSENGPLAVSWLPEL